mmetsp:Transcript_41596/g.61006  ORF Transcript_41596/g.61006 Transcript_41596/m.61006 type:complete len:209 (-) Transcript_41596:488-1114(-)|eukprot:CAMPEP_0195527766 /NCGR_PEP_ID=MMETSP0794_2-20130614/29675_1 /TAXON_ID=515487 /ORGANISM="Stephanopyxis turris, Strain CCMP 815" /LENGTH=208 /DNA_ID=CAMNT_0040658759 /DNA_START=168 /DNA_END=794 /DNA_ORIENTATION=+
MASPAARRMVGKLSTNTTAMLLCDIQDKFIPHIHNRDTVVQTAKLLTSVSNELSIPLVATEQYPRAFGHTVTDCFTDGQVGETPVFEKKLFSMMTPEVHTHLESLDEKISSFILFGVEAHVCVQQTALDLLEAGHDVHVVVDGVSSMKLLDRDIALQRMSSAGAYLTTAQSAVFMLLKSADHPNFKAVSKLVKDHAALSNEFNDAVMK